MTRRKEKNRSFLSETVVSAWNSFSLNNEFHRKHWRHSARISPLDRKLFFPSWHDLNSSVYFVIETYIWNTWRPETLDNLLCTTHLPDLSGPRCTRALIAISRGSKTKTKMYCEHGIAVLLGKCMYMSLVESKRSFLTFTGAWTLRRTDRNYVNWIRSRVNAAIVSRTVVKFQNVNIRSGISTIFVFYFYYCEG